MFPSIKKRYDYGVMIFILTFNLVVVSGVRTDQKIWDLARERLSTIFMGFIVCICVNLLVFPLWASDELHGKTVSTFHDLANSFQGIMYSKSLIHKMFLLFFFLTNYSSVFFFINKLFFCLIQEDLLKNCLENMYWKSNLNVTITVWIINISASVKKIKINIQLKWKFGLSKCRLLRGIWQIG